ncbi:unnamed protein product, partial [Effrenium voratum]
MLKHTHSFSGLFGETRGKTCELPSFAVPALRARADSATKGTSRDACGMRREKMASLQGEFNTPGRVFRFAGHLKALGRRTPAFASGVKTSASAMRGSSVPVVASDACMLKSLGNAAAGAVLGIRMGLTLSGKELKEKEGKPESRGRFGHYLSNVSVEEEVASGKRLLEEYSVGDALGEGAFGVVYACKHRKSGMEVAVKMVDKVETPPAVIRREAEVMKALRHENIVRFHAVYFERCFVCIVMDKYSGGDLVDGMQAHMKERGKINARDIIHISYQMVASIQYLHGKRIVHRDIKGDNFLLTRQDLRDPLCRVAFIMVVCFGVFVFLTRNLRETVTPICWAAFFAVPSTLLIASLDRCINIIMSAVSRLWHRALRDRHLEAPEFVHFTSQGDGHIVLDNSSGNVLFLHKVNTPCGSCSNCLRKAMAFLKLESFFRRRVQVTSLTSEDGEEELPEVNRLVKGWTYYVFTEGEQSWSFLSASDSQEGSGSIRLELYVDASKSYPAVLPRGQNGTRTLHGTLEMDKSSSVTWFLSLLLTLAIISGGVWFFVTCIQLGVKSFTDNLDDYKKGVTEFLDLIKPILPESTWKELQQKITDFLNNELASLASSLLNQIESLGFQALMFFVYLFFWLFEPLPISSPVAEVFKSYLLLKTCVCLLFAAMMSGLLAFLQCKIWSLFFVLTFLLNYIPEIGAIAAAILTVPAILFDGHLSQEVRLENLLWLVIFGTAIKVFTGNVVEVQLYATMGGQFMRMHPVVIMALIMLFSSLLGVTGMFLAVPTMAAVKYYLVSTDMPFQFQHPLLVMIEGDAARTAECLEGGRRLSSEVGTRIFWAPEIFAKDYGLKVDVWALGIIMYGLLDGRFPFKDEQDIKSKAPKFPKRLEPLCQDFVSAMLQKEEEHRASADDVIVHRWLHQTDDGVTPKQRSDSKEGARANDSLEVFQHEEQNHGVTERRRELMERLNNEHAKGPSTVGFMHCASLTEFSVPDRRLPGAHWRYQWWDRSQADYLGISGQGLRT